MQDDWRNRTMIPSSNRSGRVGGLWLLRELFSMKFYERLVESRMSKMVPISQEQWRFMPESSTIDAIFIARHGTYVIKKRREK